MTLNLKKEAETLKVGDIELGTCPVCLSYVSHIYFMQDAKTKTQSKWYSCACGVVWNSQKPNIIYDRKYWDKYDQFDKKLKDAYEYPIRIYAPLIEELIYGRRVLIIGQTTNHQCEEFKRRGWIPTVIDKNNTFDNDDGYISDNFETHEFPESEKYSMVWIYHTLECFEKPVEALSKIKSLLTEDGILFIGTPDTDFIHTRGSCGFIHWKPDMNYLMWNKRSLIRHLETLGFNVIMARQNYEHRFPIWDDLHCIAQKKFF